MMFWLSVIYSFVAPLGVLLIPKGMLTNRIIEGVKDEKLSLIAKILNYIPWLNSYKLRKEVNGQAPFYFILAIIAVPTFAALLAVRFAFIQWEGLQLLMTLWMLVFLLVSYVAELFLLFESCTLFDKKKFIPFVLVPFLGAALLLPHIKPYFKKYYDEINGTFNGVNNK